ncbi:hypothetical protein UlMin_005854 [Ulmus minor]
MGIGRRKEILLVFAVVMMLGIAVYLRLWTIDYNVSSVDAELLRRQFDLANREAIEESAAWRLRFDEEAERVAQCMSELKQVKESSMKDDGASSINQKLTILQKENMGLLKQLEALKQELEAEKLKCSVQ